jgi:adenylate cyclase class 2
VKRQPEEVEIKFAVTDPRALSRALKKAGFKLRTKRTFESNILYDFPDRRLRAKGELIRIRQYGNDWKLTFKAKGKDGRHKRREEIETTVADGKALEQVVTRLGLARSFAYEKYRTEWSDGTGDIVVDETPIGHFGEIEGPARWIDSTAKKLDLGRSDYITKSYAELFSDWKRDRRSKAADMTFAAIKANKRSRRAAVET